MKIEGYKYGRKNNARSWVWNRIEERLSCAKRDAVVLYLAGKEDLDRREAIRRGFRSENLIAIDTDREVVEKLRGENKIAIHGDMIDAFAHFGGKCKVDVVIADLLGGLDCRNGLGFLFYCCCAFHAFNESPVIAMNMQRGQDGKLSPLMNDLFNDGRMIEAGYPPTKHRGELAYRWCISALVSEDELYWSRLMVLVEKNKVPMKTFFERLFKPAFFSYRSQGSVMRDLVVMNLPFDGVEHDETKEIMDHLRAKNKHLSAVVAAAKAVRTMRASGKLPPASMF